MRKFTGKTDKNGVSDYSHCEYYDYHEGAKYCSGCGWKMNER